MDNEELMPRWVSNDGLLIVEIKDNLVFYSTGRINDVSRKNEICISVDSFGRYEINFMDLRPSISLLGKPEAEELSTLLACEITDSEAKSIFGIEGIKKM